MSKNETEFNILRNEDGSISPNKPLQEAIIEAQFKTAMNGNSEMLKWLGQQYLNQSVNKLEATNDSCPLVFCYGNEGDCPLQKYIEHKGLMGTDDYKNFMKENYGKEE